MAKNKFFCVCVLFAVILSGQAFGADELICGMEANYPPFAYIDKNTGKPAGFDVEVINRIAEEIGMEVTFRPLDWGGIINNLLASEIDIIASGMNITEERSKRVDFSTPYFTIKQVVVVRNGTSITAEQIMSGEQPLGVQKGSPLAEWFKRENDQKGYNMSILDYDSAPLQVEALLNGQIAAAAMDDAGVRDAMGKEQIQVLGSFGLLEAKLGYAVRKNDQVLLGKVNDALSKLMGTPDWIELRKKYNLIP